MAEIMDRNNETWLAQLGGDGPNREAALADLRDALLRGLRRALRKWSITDEAFLEDSVQDSLIRILDRRSQFEGRSRFLTWATAIAIRVALSELRRRRWRDLSLDELLTDGNLSSEISADDELRPDTQWERKSVREGMIEKLHNIIQNDLTEKQRAALLAELKGMPQDEIARHLGSNRNAVYKLTHDARKRVKRELESASYRADDLRATFEN
ncbi:MAG: RNA polymerase sigma factor [Methylocystis sp.]